MRRLIANDSRNAQRIFPFIGGEEVNGDPRHAHHRYIIDFADFPLGRRGDLKPWALSVERERAACQARGLVPTDYVDAVAEDWPELIDIIRRRVKPDRDVQKRDALRDRWWQYADKRPGLYRAIRSLDRVLVVNCGATPHAAFCSLSARSVFAHSLVVCAFPTLAPFATLQSRPHEIWAWTFSSSMKDDLRYAPSDCFRTFPFPRGFEANPSLETVGETYHAHRAALMLERDEGLTKTYNRFHASAETAPDIERLRELHAEMDRAVLRAYGWDDLAERAAPEFIEQEVDEGKTPKTRLDWPAEFKDEVLARLLGLNAQRSAEERTAGLARSDSADEDDSGDESD